MYFSPKTSADGLVFHYDTGNTIRSYLGEPTTNVYGNWVQYTANSYEVLDNSTNYVKLLASAGTPWSGRFEATVSTGTYTVSFQHRTDNSNTTSFVIDNDAQDDNIWNATVSTTVEWQTYTSTKTHTGTGNHLLYFRRNGGDGNVYIRNVQLELKSHATPFIKGTRSATQGLKDLTAKNTINIANVSFDSNAQMTFDGTNDYVRSDASAVLNANTYLTLEAVIKPSSTYSGDIIILGRSAYYLTYQSNDSLSVYWYGKSPAGYHSTSAGTVQRNKYNHIVAVWNDANVKLYVNGTLLNTVNSTGTGDSVFNDLWVGSEYDGGQRIFNGEIPVAKIYSRALTADEVARNFNAIKSRFNIG